jgi:hypothetical protein
MLTGVSDWNPPGGINYNTDVILENCERKVKACHVRLKIGWTFTMSLLKKLRAVSS